MNKKEEYEKRVIGGKKVRIKTIYPPYKASAGMDNKTIFLSEKLKKDLSPEELNCVLYHEVGHFTLVNLLLTWLPRIIIFGVIFYLFLNYLNVLINFIFLSFPIIYTLCFLFIGYFTLLIVGCIIELPFMWAREILADWYAVKRTKKDHFRKTLEKFYKYNWNNSNSSFNRFYSGAILHPPQPIRLKIIKHFEKIRDYR
jgi:Zn-dependent protease with chaperone function